MVVAANVRFATKDTIGWLLKVVLLRLMVGLELRICVILGLQF